MLAYKALEDTYNDDFTPKNLDSSKSQKSHYNHTLIEKCVSLFRKRRLHRNIIDFDLQYVKDETMKHLLSKICKPEIKKKKKQFEFDTKRIFEFEIKIRAHTQNIVHNFQK